MLELDLLYTASTSSFSVLTFWQTKSSKCFNTVYSRGTSPCFFVSAACVCVCVDLDLCRVCAVWMVRTVSLYVCSMCQTVGVQTLDLYGVFAVWTVRTVSWSVCSICQTVGVQTNGDPQHCVCKSNIGTIYSALLTSLGDYAMDSRGDVGSW